MTDSSPISPLVIIERCCWIAVAIIPGLIWFNGPAVSPDQQAMRWVVSATVLVTALVISRWRRTGKKPPTRGDV